MTTCQVVFVSCFIRSNLVAITAGEAIVTVTLFKAISIKAKFNGV
jgi:hypothetical protein